MNTFKKKLRTTRLGNNLHQFITYGQSPQNGEPSNLKMFECQEAREAKGIKRLPKCAKVTHV